MIGSRYYPFVELRYSISGFDMKEPVAVRLEYKDWMIINAVSKNASVYYIIKIENEIVTDAYWGGRWLTIKEAVIKLIKYRSKKKIDDNRKPYTGKKLRKDMHEFIKSYGKKVPDTQAYYFDHFFVLDGNYVLPVDISRSMSKPAKYIRRELEIETFKKEIPDSWKDQKQ